MVEECIVSLTGDPITYGHRDIIKRAKAIFKFVHILIPEMSSKKGALLSYEDRKAAIEQDLWSDGVFNGVDFLVEPIHPGEALVDAARRYPGCNVVVRGLRNEQDLIYEMDMGSVNRMLNPDIETLYLPCKPELSFVSSSMVRELVHLGKYETAEAFTSVNTMKLMKRACTKVVALTGRIACGKSTVREVFKEHGWHVVDADQINKERILGFPKYVEEIAAALMPYGKVNVQDPAKSIASIVFSNSEALHKLEAMSFPMIHSMIKDICCNWREAASKKILVEVPLLFEDRAKQFNDFFDVSICIESPAEVCIKRMVENRGMTHDEAVARLKSQMPAEAKAEMADYAIHNGADTSLLELRTKVSEIVEEIERKQK